MEKKYVKKSDSSKTGITSKNINKFQCNNIEKNSMELKIKTRSQNKPILDFNNQPFPIPKKDIQKNNTQTQDTYQVVKEIMVNTVKNNKLTFGTTQMMENEKIHAQEAIESGVYITWSTSFGDKKVDCFRIGSNSMCICNHGFNSHEKILNKKRQSSKCANCKCKAFTYIPIYPEEVGEYWLAHRNQFEYSSWKAKCKCNHTYVEHNAEIFLSCKKCNCFQFNSNFCCAVCDKFWQEHEMVWELEHERLMAGKPIGQDFVPFNEMPEMYKALYEENNKYNNC